MRQTTPTLVVDTTKINEEEMMYELNITPRASLDSQYTTSTSMGDLKKSIPPPTFPLQQIPQGPSLQPSLRLLFSLISRRHFFFLLLPAILSSIIAGGIAPFMTFVVGQAFNAFAQYPLTPNPPQEAKDTLLRGVGLAALELVGLAIGSLALGSITSSLWIWVGEINALAVRERVYDAVTNKEMVWFDTQIGMGGSADSVDEDSQPVGAGGLMAKFSRETDDVRTASSLASGMVLQYLTTTIACLILAFVRSWALTLVILSAVPLLTFIQGLSQGLAGPLLNHEREETGVAATMVDRAVSGIATVKAFNAAPFELARTALSFTRLQVAAKSLNKVWGVTSGLAQFVMMAMFVQGFWFGSKLVREGRVNAGDVMAVFWACLIATSNLQMCIPMMITLTKGKMAMVALMELVGSDSPAPISNSEVPSSPVMPTHSRGSKSRTLRKIVPTRCHGELALHSVTFSYPSRPTLPVLSSVSLFLPANEITFIVGASGSGKSTIAGLLLRMYQPRDDSGMVLLDEQDVRFLDEKWMRRHLVGVGQQGAAGVVILEGQSIWDNILVGLPEDDPYSITFSSSNKFTLETAPASLRLRVETACRAALLHEFIRDMPNGYETILGGGAGLGLSGGQKQRLAIARAVLRDPTVLILDEPTSALDPTTRLLVFSALKQQRKNKTTIVITHDLSQIEKNDFVYVMKDGRVVEGGYRCDLEEVFESDNMDGRGEFKKMMESQMKTGGFLPAVEDESTPTPIYDEEEEESNEDEERDVSLASIRPLTWGNWMFEVVADLTRTANATSTGSPSELEKGQQQNASNIPAYKKKRPSSIAIPQTPIVEEDEIPSPESKRYSLPFTPNSVATSFTAVDRSYYGYGAGSGKHLPSSLSKGHISEESPEYEEEEKEFDSQKNAIKKSGDAVSASRKMTRNRANAIQMTEIKVVSNATPVEQQQEHEEDFSQPPFWKLMRAIFPTVPNKPLLFAGIAISLLSGAMTPLFSFLLSRLLFEVSIGATNTKVINFFGGLVLGIAAFDGLLLGTKYFIMETVGMSWVTRIRNISFSRVLAQDKAWFDMPKHAPARLAQIIVRDADDARDLVSVVWAQFCVVIAMLSVGLIWALVQGWQLTLVGFAIAPVFAGVMAVQTMLVARCEVRNKRAREEVARGYYEAIVHVRGIRAMSCEKVFEGQFKAAAENALKTGVRGAFVEGCTYGVASGLIYLAEALLFYVGAVLISKGLYTYLQMVQVLNLVVFTVTIGSQLMAFTQRIAKCVQATSDFNKLMTLSTDNTSESSGSIKTDLSGPISLSNVSFTYPSRPSQPVLRNVNLTVEQGERVALVGSSGSGKSTIAALLQRLYEPTGGKITVGDVNLDQMDVKHLRKQVSVVSQQPNLFDASVAENVRYGGVATFTGNDDDLVISDIGIRSAAKKALVHDFVMGLPQGYDTPVGENASLISGGQAQRLQIARALARPSRVLILDECTSALDPENQTAVLDTIMRLRDDDERRTTIMVTHKLQVMQTCDRIVVVHEGVIAEEGTYQQLIERKGVFATLATAGEWNGE